MITQSRLAPAARSIAPPTAGAVSFSLVAQFARSPFSATSKAPSTQRSMWPPRIIAKLSAWPTKLAPLARVISCLPALISQGSSCPLAGAGPMPMTPFSDWNITSRVGGTWFATMVGMPMPRLTHQPSGTSSARRSAIWSRVKGMVRPPSSSFGLQPIAAAIHLDHAVHIDAGGHDHVRVQLAKLTDVLHLGDGQLRRHGHDRVEIGPRPSVDEVAPAVGLPGLHQRHIGLQR